MRLTLVLAATAAGLFGVPATAGTKLWGDFEAGMTPQQVVEIALQVPGVKGAKIKEKNDRVDVDVSHGMYSKFEVAGKKSQLSFDFRDGTLLAVVITPEPYEFGAPGCIEGGVRAFRYFDQLLSTKYERNVAPIPDISDNEVQSMVSLARLSALAKKPYEVPVRSMAAGYTDGNLQVINRVSFGRLPAVMCSSQGSLGGRDSLTYIDKATYQSLASEVIDAQKATVADLADDL